MRFVVVGAGAIGGVIGGRLHEHGHDVVLVARGDHHDAIRDRGLSVASPGGRVTLRLPVVDRPDRVAWRADDVALLSVKGQHTADALEALSDAAPAGVAVACAQNGVSNEAAVSARFPHVYGVLVRCPSSFVSPGEVVAYSAPTTGILDIGVYPAGTDAVAEAVAGAFRESTFRSDARTDIMRWKYAKLVLNLRNAAVALCDPGPARKELIDRARREGVRALRAAGIDFVPVNDLARDLESFLSIGPVEGRGRPGGSSWQSLARRAGSVEADHLNGEIVRLGRLHGVPTPVNELLRRLVLDAAHRRLPPEGMSAERLLADVPDSAAP